VRLLGGAGHVAGFAHDHKQSQGGEIKVAHGVFREQKMEINDIPIWKF